MVPVRFACALTVFLALSAFGARDALPQSVVSQIEKAFEKKQAATSTYESNFKQTLRLKGVREAIVSSGKFYYEAPGRLLIQFREPRGEYVMIKDAELTFKKHAKPLVRSRISSDDWQSGPAMLLELFRDGGKRFGEHYDIQMKDDGNWLLVTLVRKDDDEDLPAIIENKLLRKSFEIRSIRVHSNENESLLYEFTNPVWNRPIDPSVFHRGDKS